MSLVSCILALELGLECWLITKQCQSSTVSTTSPLPAFPGNTILQCLLALGIIVNTNTNHVPFSAFPAIQPLMTFPVTSRNVHIQSKSEGMHRLNGQKDLEQPVKQVAFMEEGSGKEWENIVMV